MQIKDIHYKIGKSDIIKLIKNKEEIGFLKINKTRISLSFYKFDGINFVFKDVDNNDNFQVVKNLSVSYN